MRQGRPIVEEFVVADRVVSGASVAGRDGLQRLLKAAKARNRPFDCLLVDDTSRLARDLSDALRTQKTLEFYGVSIVSVSQGTDSSQGGARHRVGKESATAVLPVVVKVTAVPTTTKRYDSVGATDSPEHAGALEPGTHDGFAAGLDDPGADK